MLKPKQVDLSMLFPEHDVAEGKQRNPVPVFLSGEKKQAVYISTLIPPASKVVGQVQLQNYLYVTSYLLGPMKLTPLRSKHSIELSRDLDDSAIFLLVENGFHDRFPVACDAWKARNTNSREIAQKSVYENRQLVDEQLKCDQPLLEGVLAREITRRISDACPYVLPFESYLSK